jgi:hypothetical protein
MYIASLMYAQMKKIKGSKVRKYVDGLHPVGCSLLPEQA